MKPYQLYIFDLDGTLYRGAEPVPNAVDTVVELKRRGAMIRYLTNNSGQTRDFYTTKLRDMGFPVDPSEVFSSAMGAAQLCVDRGLRKVFYVGQPGLKETLLSYGLNVLNEGEDMAEKADVVVAGICRAFTYRWMNSAMQQILQGASFVATNKDATFPVENNRTEPGAGSIVAAIQTCSGAAPEVIGKPNPLLLELIFRQTGVSAQEVLAVGDRLDTDIESGKAAGCDTHLVLTGVSHSAPAGQSSSEDLLGLL